MEKVLVTGGAGYIGSVLVRKLLRNGFSVRVLDCLKRGDEGIRDLYGYSEFEVVTGDLRSGDQISKALKGTDHVIHLAAIVGDPACAKEPELAEEVNWQAARELYDRSIQSGIKRFVFSSTCSNYGKMLNDGWVNELSELRPVSLYARLKVKFEQYLLEKRVSDSFCPVVFRFATAYGISPNMRFDLTVNEFIATAVAGKELVIYGKEFWRPYCHIEDLSRACLLALSAPVSKVRAGVFNVGSTEENYQKKTIADIVIQNVDQVKVRYIEKDEDPRDYRVNFSKIESELGFRISKTVPEGILEIKQALEAKTLQISGF